MAINVLWLAGVCSGDKRLGSSVESKMWPCVLQFSLSLKAMVYFTYNGVIFIKSLSSGGIIESGFLFTATAAMLRREYFLSLRPRSCFLCKSCEISTRSFLAGSELNFELLQPRLSSSHPLARGDERPWERVWEALSNHNGDADANVSNWHIEL